MIENKVLIFADGSSRGNPGRGGYGSIVMIGTAEQFLKNNKDLVVKELGARDPMTTNNKMELKAIIDSFKYIESKKLDSSYEYIIYTDSKYVVTGAKNWIFGWQKNGWKTTTKEDVKNRELWEELYDFINDKKINWHLLPGHAGIAGNERCDEIATSFADNETPDLYSGKFENYSNSNVLDIFYNSGLITAAKELKDSTGKKSSSAKAYSYVSKVDGVLNIDKTWTECEKRVKGKKGALFKKSISKSDEENILNDFKSR